MGGAGGAGEAGKDAMAAVCFGRDVLGRSSTLSIARRPTALAEHAACSLTIRLACVCVCVCGEESCRNVQRTDCGACRAHCVASAQHPPKVVDGRLVDSAECVLRDAHDQCMPRRSGRIYAPHANLITYPAAMYLSALVPLLLLLAGAGRCLGGDLAVPFRPSGSYCETVTFGNPSLVTVNSIGNHRVRLTMCDCRMTNTSGSFAHMQDYAPAKLPRAVLKQNTYMLDVLKDVTGLVPTVGGFALAGLDIIEKTIRNFDPDKPRTVEETANALAEQVERELRDLKRYVDDKIVLTHLDTLRHRLSGYVRVSSDCHRLQSHLAEFAQCVHGLHEQMRAAIDDFLPAADPIASYLEYLPVFEGFAFWVWRSAVPRLRHALAHTALLSHSVHGHCHGCPGRAAAHPAGHLPRPQP